MLKKAQPSIRVDRTFCSIKQFPILKVDGWQRGGRAPITRDFMLDLGR